MSTSTSVVSIEPDYTTTSGDPITESDLKDLFLKLRVAGVLYGRDDDGKASATVLLDLTFSLPRQTEMGKYDHFLPVELHLPDEHLIC